jgi:hypothetical protein
MEGSGRGQVTVPVFAWKNCETPRITSVRIAEILTWDLPNTKQEC